MDLSRQKGASIWLSALPLESHGFSLHKQAFWDALYLRYSWTIPNTPSHCVCGHKFVVDHALYCPKGGFPSIRHNKVRDLQPLYYLKYVIMLQLNLIFSLFPENIWTCLLTANTDANARLDIAADSVWGGRFERSYFDVRVFNPFAQSNLQTSLDAVYRRHKLDKIHQYDQRLREVKYLSFTPLIFSSSRGMGKVATTFYKRIASMLAEKKHFPPSMSIGLIRCRISYALLRSSIMCIREARSLLSRPVLDSPFDLQAADN